ncbi:MAG: hypothetical protein JOZ91_03330 [Candidatus Eremiobacteraeota bacterium]|nr:hypothetical protein [Candidatus Eremiobacteraeota bacterium]MBV8459313.1 hypothetical protein [Candidatus Eremiobacteraeota bacterium]
MSLELVNTLATFGTFVVIAATAVAALVQLRHSRSSNLIETLAEFRQEAASSDMAPALRFVRFDLSKKLEDPAFRYQMANPDHLTEQNAMARFYISRVANYYDGMGALVKYGLADKNLVLDSSTTTLALLMWNRLSPVIAIIRQSFGDPSFLENFEYLIVLAQDWKAAHPNGSYPAGVRRIEINYPWFDADKQYAISLKP